MKQAAFLFLSLAIGTSALAHTGVTNPTVLAWMDGMKGIGQSTKTLSQMARGQIEHDPAKAKAALQTMAEQTRKIPTLFEEPAFDPNSEAHDAIWKDWERFASLAYELEDAISKADISSQQALAISLKEIGQSCSACHQDFRIEN